VSCAQVTDPRAHNDEEKEPDDGRDHAFHHEALSHFSWKCAATKIDVMPAEAKTRGRAMIKDEDLDDKHANSLRGGKRPRTTLSPTIVLRDGKPFLALSSPGGDTQDQQALQVFLNVAVFGMRAQEAIEAPRFNSYAYRESFRDHAYVGGALQLESRIEASVAEGLARLGHQVAVIGPFMMNTGTVLAGVDPEHGSVFGAADVRRQRFVTGW